MTAVFEIRKIFDIRKVFKSRFVCRYYLYNGEIHPQDQEYTCLEILVDVFGFSPIIYGFDPRPPNLESESSQSLAGKKI